MSSIYLWQQQQQQRHKRIYCFITTFLFAEFLSWFLSSAAPTHLYLSKSTSKKFRTTVMCLSYNHISFCSHPQRRSQKLLSKTAGPLSFSLSLSFEKLKLIKRAPSKICSGIYRHLTRFKMTDIFTSMQFLHAMLIEVPAIPQNLPFRYNFTIPGPTSIFEVLS